ncbi:hypothetical protein ACE1B6_24245 [Aerosakkonemataceae cyanobacterium BLCC-F154]|uniref:Uncharacterized protein n=1 Tax=Floridaenema fluviatile BLCC-F154 TaxID=3153640 RepID=A0ABV4YKK5_9CYAN
MAKSKTKGKAFDPVKHPRGIRGRFTTKAVKEVPSSTRLASILKLRERRQIEQAHLEILADIGREKRAKLFNVLSIKARKNENESQNESVQDSEVAKTNTRKVSKRLPTLRPVASEDSFIVSRNGLELWKNNPDLEKFDDSFKYRERRFTYEVEYEGKKLKLNENRGIIHYQGERVYGVPKLSQDIDKATNEKLFDNLIAYTSHVENAKNRSVSPPAPEWKPTIHGSPVDKSLVRSKRGEGNYGEMQLHHIQQFARRDFAEVVRRHELGEITLEEAKKEASKLLTRTERINGKTGETEAFYEIKIKSQKDRAYVVLASGIHDINSPLYAANHPSLYHPETGKLQRFGIPKTGSDGSRDSHNTFRSGFWEQYYRKEAIAIKDEVNRRIKAGDLTSEQAKTLLNQARSKAQRAYDAIEKLREDRQAAKEN